MVAPYGEYIRFSILLDRVVFKGHPPIRDGHVVCSGVRFRPLLVPSCTYYPRNWWCGIFSSWMLADCRQEPPPAQGPLDMERNSNKSRDPGHDTRALNLLRLQGVRTLQDLLSFDASKAYSIRGYGSAVYNHILEVQRQLRSRETRGVSEPVSSELPYRLLTASVSKWADLALSQYGVTDIYGLTRVSYEAFVKKTGNGYLIWPEISSVRRQAVRALG